MSLACVAEFLDHRLSSVIKFPSLCTSSTTLKARARQQSMEQSGNNSPKVVEKESGAEREELALSYGATPPSPTKSSSPLPLPATTKSEADALSLVTASSLFQQAQEIRESAVPWKEFYDTKQMSLPAFSALSDRVSQNLSVYQGNYLVITVLIFAFTALWNLGGLLFFALLMMGFLKFGKKHVDKTDDNVKTKRMIVLGSIVLFLWITGVGGMVASTLFFSSIYCVGHALIRNPERAEFEIEPI